VSVELYHGTHAYALVMIFILLVTMASFMASSMFWRMICHLARQNCQGLRGCLDNVARSGRAVLGTIDHILERDPSAASDSLTALIGDFHVPA
jgi:hypothetical protein